MALLLHLETTTTNCSVSLGKDGRLLALKEHNAAQYAHSKQLHLFIQAVMEAASLSFSDLDAVAVSEGPGSYTGLRIGVAAAKGLCFALNLPLISIPTLQSMAQQVRAKKGEVIISALDARRMEVYAAVFDANYTQIRETCAEGITEASFSAFASRSKVHVIGSGAEKCKAVLKQANFTFNSAVVPSAREMVAMAFTKYQGAQFETLAYFEPRYLKNVMLQAKRKPQATGQ